MRRPWSASARGRGVGGDDLGDDLEGLAVAAQKGRGSRRSKLRVRGGAGPARVGRGGNRGAARTRSRSDRCCRWCRGISRPLPGASMRHGATRGGRRSGGRQGRRSRRRPPCRGARRGGMADDEVPAAELGSGRGDGERLVEGVSRFRAGRWRWPSRQTPRRRCRRFFGTRWRGRALAAPGNPSPMSTTNVISDDVTRLRTAHPCEVSAGLTRHVNATLRPPVWAARAHPTIVRP